MTTILGIPTQFTTWFCRTISTSMLPCYKTFLTPPKRNTNICDRSKTVNGGSSVWSEEWNMLEKGDIKKRSIVTTKRSNWFPNSPKRTLHAELRKQ